ncbi:MAG: exodeoxyribonuclease III [Coriobacteriales bacterium]
MPHSDGALRMVSWNVNGLRAVLKKGFDRVVDAVDADIIALQETKLQDADRAKLGGQLELPGYHQTWNYAQRKGYSGTAVFSREEPMGVRYGFAEDPDDEGRICALEFPRFWFVDVYTPNAQEGLARIDYRMAWDDAFRGFLGELEASKPVVTCGDFNVAHEEIDIKNPGPNRGKAGFSDQERGKFTELLDAGFTDTFRMLHPDQAGAYSWWSYRFNARARNAGWRIDYFLVSDQLRPRVREASILSDVYGSDHCPVELEIAL